jgi:hypothetical protein
MAFKLDAGEREDFIHCYNEARTKRVHGYDYCLAEILEAYAHEKAGICLGL